MTRAQAKQEYKEREITSTIDAMDLIKNQISWLEYVPEFELRVEEKARILKACEEMYLVLRPLTNKYID